MNPEVKETFKVRTAIIKEIRAILDEKGYLEVETPILNTISGGATALEMKVWIFVIIQSLLLLNFIVLTKIITI